MEHCILSTFWLISWMSSRHSAVAWSALTYLPLCRRTQINSSKRLWEKDKLGIKPEFKLLCFGCFRSCCQEQVCVLPLASCPLQLQLTVYRGKQAQAFCQKITSLSFYWRRSADTYSNTPGGSMKINSWLHVMLFDTRSFILKISSLHELENWVPPTLCFVCVLKFHSAHLFVILDLVSSPLNLQTPPWLLLLLSAVFPYVLASLFHFLTFMEVHMRFLAALMTALHFSSRCFDL